MLLREKRWVFFRFHLCENRLSLSLSLSLLRGDGEINGGRRGVEGKGNEVFVLGTILAKSREEK